MQNSVSNMIASAAFLTLGAFWLLSSLVMPTGSAPHVFGSPRTFPQLVAVIIIVVSTIQLIGQIRSAVRNRRKEDIVDGDGQPVADLSRNYGPLAGLLAVTVLYCLTVRFLTYLPATILLLGSVLWIFGVRSKSILFGVSVVVPVLLLAVFRYLLQVPLP